MERARDRARGVARQRRRGGPGAGLPAPLTGRPSYGEIHRFCDDLVRATGVDSLADIDPFIARLAELQGGDIHTLRMKLPAGLFGFSGVTDSGYHMTIGENFTEEVQVVSRLHEVMHIVSGHVDDGSPQRCGIGSVSGPVADRERLAETGATILALRALIDRRHGPEGSNGRDGRQLGEVMMGRMKWGW